MVMQANDEDQRRRQQLTGGSSVIAGAGATGTNTAAAPAAGKPAGSGSWTNIRRYLNANTQADGSANDAVSQGVDQIADAGNKAISGYDSAAETAAHVTDTHSLADWAGGRKAIEGAYGNVGTAVKGMDEAAKNINDPGYRATTMQKANNQSGMYGAGQATLDSYLVNAAGQNKFAGIKGALQSRIDGAGAMGQDYEQKVAAWDNAAQQYRKKTMEDPIRQAQVDASQKGIAGTYHEPVAPTTPQTHNEEGFVIKTFGPRYDAQGNVIPGTEPVEEKKKTVTTGGGSTTNSRSKVK